MMQKKIVLKQKIQEHKYKNINMKVLIFDHPFMTYEVNPQRFEYQNKKIEREKKKQ